jgi:uncharacterized protein (TIGR03086 family)
MAEVADNWSRIAAGFTQRVDAVAPDQWDAPSPCEGWVARDVVGHLVEWVPPFLATGVGVVIVIDTDVDRDPAAAWHELCDQIQAQLDDPGVSERRFSHPQAGDHALDDAISMFILGDVLLHTWDLARATGQDDTLDAAFVAAMAEGMEAMGDALEQSGQYGPRVAVPSDADPQTKLLALSGRQP